MKKLLILTWFLLLQASACLADIYVVTHRDNPLAEMAPQQVRDLYLARSRAFLDGKFATVYDRNDALRERFVQSVLGMKIRQFDAYWARLVFAGRVLPLNLATQNSELIERISKDVNAIGYMDSAPESGHVKTLLRIAD